MRPEEVINKMKETRGQSETGHSKRTEFGHGHGHEEVVLPIVAPSKRKIGVEPLDPPPVKQPSDSPGPVRRLSVFEVDLIGLVGSTEVPALLIPADDSRPVTKTEFDLDKIWRYDAVGYDKNRVFLTEKNAYLDHLTNSLATDWVQHHSDAATDPDSRLPSPERLYGPVYVVARDPIMKWITQSTTQLDKLKDALGWIDPFRRTE
jgi:hypothetical protein